MSYLDTGSKFIALVIPSCPGALFDLATNRQLASILYQFVREKSKSPMCSIVLNKSCFVRATVCCRVWGGWSVQCSGQAESAVGLQGLQHDSSECCLYWVGAMGEGHMISVIFFMSKC